MYIGGAFANISNLVGAGNPSDTLIGSNETWDITGPNSGAVGGVTFSAFANLDAESGTNDFAFLPSINNSPGGSLSGSIVADGGFNTLDFSQLSGPVANGSCRGHSTGNWWNLYGDQQFYWLW